MPIKPAPGHSTVILSAYRGEYGSIDNDARHISLASVAAAELVRGRALAAVQLDGCYKGESEPSIAITMQHSECVKFGRQTGKLFEQESVLFVDSAGNGRLYYLDTGEIEPIGSLTIVEGTEGRDAYSISKATGEVFAFE